MIMASCVHSGTRFLSFALWSYSSLENMVQGLLDFQGLHFARLSSSKAITTTKTIFFPPLKCSAALKSFKSSVLSFKNRFANLWVVEATMPSFNGKLQHFSM